MVNVSSSLLCGAVLFLPFIQYKLLYVLLHITCQQLVHTSVPHYPSGKHTDMKTRLDFCSCFLLPIQLHWGSKGQLPRPACWEATMQTFIYLNIR